LITLKLWRTLHTYPSFQETLLRILHLKPRRAINSILYNLWAWVILNTIQFFVTFQLIILLFIMNSPFFALNWVIYVFLILLSFFPAARMLNTMYRMHSEPEYDLISILPAGELATRLNICRAHRYPLQGKLRGKWLLVLVLCLYISAYIPPTFAYFASNSVGLYVPFLIGGALDGIWGFIRYLQLFVMAILIALFASKAPTRGQAFVWLISGYAALQVLFYIADTLLSSIMRLPIPESIGSLRVVILSITFNLIAITLREAVNFGLWRMVQRSYEAA
jgi:hypothetical protein